MAFSGMDKDERQASGIDFWEGDNWEKVRIGQPLPDHYARKRVSGRGGRC
jgi:hypothetical protein